MIKPLKELMLFNNQWYNFNVTGRARQTPLDDLCDDTERSIWQINNIYYLHPLAQLMHFRIQDD
jgi:hypothetical protein